MANLVGQSVDRYHIIEQLGEGGMATVYKAYDTRLECNVAVKFIRTDNLSPRMLGQSLKRFEREAKSLGKLTHTNIVSVSDYGEYEGMPYLVMEYLPGGTLKEKLTKPIPWQEAIQLLLPIAEALDYAHSQNMIHRDVKPANILLTQGGQPMLSDFGIAKILDLDETVDLTGTSVAMGTPEYMAPEQVTAKTVDGRADIYSLGVVLYEMVTGRKPFMADTPLAVLLKQASDPLPGPKKFVPNLPEGVERVLLKALAKQPENRYQGMNDFATALKGLLSEKLTATSVYKPPQPVAWAGPTLIDSGPPISTQTISAPPARSSTRSFFQRACLPLVVLGVIGLCVLGSVGLILAGPNLNIDLYSTPKPSPTVPATAARIATNPLSTATLLPTFTSSPVPLPVIGLFPDAETVWDDWSNDRIPSLISLLEQDWDLDEGLLAGIEYFSYTAKLRQSQSVIWSIGWCALNAQTQQQNLEEMAFEFSINDQSVPQSTFGTKYWANSDDHYCYALFVVVKDWPVGTHTIRTVQIFNANIIDGITTDVYPSGRKVIEYIVSISP